MSDSSPPVVLMNSHSRVLFWGLSALLISAVSLSAGLLSARQHGVLELAAAEERRRERAEPVEGFPTDESAQLVPGLEEVAPVHGITLSADLLTCVLVSQGDRSHKRDLYVTGRDSLDEPFGPLWPLRSCNSTQHETMPTLSPSGEWLLFVRMGEEREWCLAQRTGSRSYGPAERWEPQGVDMTERQVGCPQFVTDEVIALATTFKEEKRREVLRVVLEEDEYRVDAAYPLPIRVDPADIDESLSRVHRGATLPGIMKRVCSRYYERGVFIVVSGGRELAGGMMSRFRRRGWGEGCGGRCQVGVVRGGAHWQSQWQTGGIVAYGQRGGTWAKCG